MNHSSTPRRMTEAVSYADFCRNEIDALTMAGSFSSGDSFTTSGSLEMLDITPELLTTLPESQLLFMMPLVLHHIGKTHMLNKESQLVLPFRKRLHFSRRLKLRFLLLRNLPAFSTLSCSLRFAARAYEKPPPVSTCSSIPRLNIFDEPAPTTFKLPVDMVGMDFIPHQFTLKNFVTKPVIPTFQHFI